MVVQKYGGKSVATPLLIKSVAAEVIGRRRAGKSVLVVMSAMGSTTDELIGLAHQISDDPWPRELDMLVSVGERISIALLSMAIRDQGLESISFTGSQSGIITTGEHTRARVVDVRPGRIINALQQGKIVIVAGFQGVSLSKEITTLGRGGSDLTAVVLAKALGARRCEIKKDVPGVMTADPRLVPTARLIRRLSAEHLLELSFAGASVLHFRAAQFVCRHNIPVVICSSIEDSSGTEIVPLGDSSSQKGQPASQPSSDMEAGSLVAVASVSPVCRVRVLLGQDSADVIAELLEVLSQKGIAVDMASMNEAGELRSLGFLIPQQDRRLLEEALAGLGLSNVDILCNLAKIGVVGYGFLSDPKTVARVQRALIRAKVRPLAVHLSALRASFLVRAEDEEAAVGAVHSLIEKDRSASSRS